VQTGGRGTIAGFLPEWEKAFLEAAGSPLVEKRIAAPGLGYYKLAFESMLASETPQAVVWPLILTWTISVSVLPPMWKSHWRSACENWVWKGKRLMKNWQDWTISWTASMKCWKKWPSAKGCKPPYMVLPSRQDNGQAVDNRPITVDNPRGLWRNRSIVRL